MHRHVHSYICIYIQNFQIFLIICSLIIHFSPPLPCIIRVYSISNRLLSSNFGTTYLQYWWWCHRRWKRQILNRNFHLYQFNGVWAQTELCLPDETSAYSWYRCKIFPVHWVITFCYRQRVLEIIKHDYKFMTYNKLVPTGTGITWKQF